MHISTLVTIQNAIESYAPDYQNIVSINDNAITGVTLTLESWKGAVTTIQFDHLSELETELKKLD